MESLVALGLASNIVQFVDFASKLVANTRTLYKSASQASTSSYVLRDIGSDLERLSDAVTVPHSSADEDLKQLAQRAKEVAKDLLALLDDLKIKGRKTKWKSFLLAAKEVRSQESVASITNSITALQGQMTLHLQFRIKNDMTSLSIKIETLVMESKRLELNNASELQKLRNELLSAFNGINTLHHDRSREKADPTALVPDLEQLSIGDVHALSQRLPGYKGKISAVWQRVNSVTDDQALIESFYFNNFTTRENSVPTAHAKTFEWVFRGISHDGETKTGFPDWLQSGNGIFWIRGKAGSGKSTLMKFIGHHATTLDYLQRWSGSNKLVVASFYFWNSGTDLQKSQEGLLRSLIFEILRQCPELATNAWFTLLNMKSKSRLMAPFGKHDSVGSGSLQTVLKKLQREGWSVHGLTEILGNILGHDPSKQFCFIIDGLDEYKAQRTEDHQDLMNALRNLASSPNIKLCVSSRPWTVFVDEFGGNINRCLKLEDLTNDDIRSYVVGKFSKHNQYPKLTRMDPNYSILVEDVIRKAQGVFLWVFLVVRELLDGLTYNDTISTMRRRLDSFPDSLEGFFQHMLDSVPKFYLPQTVRVLQVASSIDHPLPVMLYSFLGDLEDNFHLASETTYQPLGVSEFRERQDAMQRRLDAWCKGLLEVVESRDRNCHVEFVVDFLHRSVRDFLVSGAISKVSHQPIHDRLQTWLLTCNAVVLSLKRSSEYDLLTEYDLPLEHHIYRAEDNLMDFARKAQDDGADSHTLNKIISNALTAISEVTGWSLNSLTHSFLYLACEYGLGDYVKSTLSSSSGYKVEDIHELMFVALVETAEPDPNIARYIISYAEANGLSSKDVFREIFDTFLDSRSKIPSRGRKDFSDIVRVIASTGYVVDEAFITANCPRYYIELMSPGCASNGRKRALEDDGFEGTGKLARHH
ncbi:hypothetical protein HD806DRAFT_542402 [Xylariaceae sp. AK1471]|nr:hypothetical protein HD806DRAFT_542402 [Xylariaceae sp. AK1471]